MKTNIPGRADPDRTALTPAKFTSNVDRADPPNRAGLERSRATVHSAEWYELGFAGFEVRKAAAKIGGPRPAPCAMDHIDLPATFCLRK